MYVVKAEADVLEKSASSGCCVPGTAANSTAAATELLPGGEPGCC